MDYNANSPILSNQELYRYFVRTVPSSDGPALIFADVPAPPPLHDANEVVSPHRPISSPLVSSQLALHLQWREIAMWANKDSYATAGAAMMRKALRNNGIIVPVKTSPHRHCAITKCGDHAAVCPGSLLKICVVSSLYPSTVPSVSGLRDTQRYE